MGIHMSIFFCRQMQVYELNSCNFHSTNATFQRIYMNEVSNCVVSHVELFSGMEIRKCKAENDRSLEGRDNINTHSHIQHSKKQESQGE